jgi:hypothetical protein
VKRYSGALFGPLDVGAWECWKTSSDLYTAKLYRQRLTFKTLCFESSGAGNPAVVSIPFDDTAHSGRAGRVGGVHGDTLDLCGARRSRL